MWIPFSRCHREVIRPSKRLCVCVCVWSLQRERVWNVSVRTYEHPSPQVKAVFECIIRFFTFCLFHHLSVSAPLCLLLALLKTSFSFVLSQKSCLVSHNSCALFVNARKVRNTTPPHPQPPDKTNGAEKKMRFQIWNLTYPSWKAPIWSVFRSSGYNQSACLYLWRKQEATAARCL